MHQPSKVNMHHKPGNYSAAGQEEKSFTGDNNDGDDDHSTL